MGKYIYHVPDFTSTTWILSKPPCDNMDSSIISACTYSYSDEVGWISVYCHRKSSYYRGRRLVTLRKLAPLQSLGWLFNSLFKSSRSTFCTIEFIVSPYCDMIFIEFMPYLLRFWYRYLASLCPSSIRNAPERKFKYIYAVLTDA